MKKSISLFALVMMTLFSMSAFAKSNDNPENTLKNAGKNIIKAVDYMEADLNEAYEDPTPSLPAGFELPESTIAIKVYSLSGDMIYESKVSVEDFFNDKNLLNKLPENALFGVYYNHTAYYMIEAEANLIR